MMWKWFTRVFGILMPSQIRQPGEISRKSFKHNKPRKRVEFDMPCEQLDTRSGTHIHVNQAQRDKQRSKSS
ncbi:hypothetical protein [Shewanella litorisediminis]|uniref:Uncharacterized protein n=1 Tax=Shewanella litorisediminis TaxID=1173586 RepID=A0ABX7FZM8_9GAMM|nr:hypothetical protein [Shewanella litorisediminis]MCL2919490.1 hypothetical protein [Shewanella litorisediminis]QRH00471.1 hypothetical protein JQC75_11245 [Shewanella litorisediminis]